jgi:Nucleotidyl transferase AbiEii toxin, Type IV TA system
MVTYEQRLDQNMRWALLEGSMHFEKESDVFKTLQRIVDRLEKLGIPYALAGAMALFLHGYRRFTEDVDLLVTPEGLKQIHEQLEGLGYVPPFAGSKQLRDSESGVRIEFLTSGEYPGDGKAKPVAFPDPADASEVKEGIRCLTRAKLIELKLASGMTGKGRRKDLADVQEMIRHLDLSREFAEELNPYVREMYQQLWSELHEE